eukprot:324754_1
MLSDGGRHRALVISDNIDPKARAFESEMERVHVVGEQPWLFRPSDNNKGHGVWTEYMWISHPKGSQYDPTQDGNKLYFAECKVDQCLDQPKVSKADEAEYQSTWKEVSKEDFARKIQEGSIGQWVRRRGFRPLQLPCGVVHGKVFNPFDFYTKKTRQGIVVENGYINDKDGVEAWRLSGNIEIAAWVFW